MSKMDKRSRKLEAKMAPPVKFVVVIQSTGESESEAIARAGLTPEDLKEAGGVIWIRGV